MRIAQKVDSFHVKVIWTREEDLDINEGASTGPSYFVPRFAAARPVAMNGMHHGVGVTKIAGSVGNSALGASDLFKDGLDPDAVDGAIDFPSDAEPSCRIRARRAALRADLLLAKRRTGTQYLRRRKFRR